MNVPNGENFAFKQFVLAAGERLLLRDGQPIDLTPKAFDLLTVLVRNAGHLVNKAQLFQEVWPGLYVEDVNLTVNISALRKALGDDQVGTKFIETVPKRGYRFVAPVTTIDDSELDHLLNPAKPTDVLESPFGETATAHEGPHSKQPLRTEPVAIWKLYAAILVMSLSIIIAGIAFLYSTRNDEPITSVAVLPFTNLSGNPNTDYLSQGISESLINSLSQLPQLKVIARSSSFKYDGQDIDLQQVANALGVQAVVTGRIVQHGDLLQINVEMVNASDKTQMWGAQYNRSAADLQRLQEEMARTISERLRVRLTGMQEDQIAKRATENPEAYQLYLNGVFYGRNGGIDDVKRSLELYQQAIARDPKFARAYVGMAESYTILVQASVLDPKEGITKRNAAVQKALELDETLADAHVMLASVKANEWDWSGAEIEYKRAITLNPNLSLAHAAYGNFLGRMGRYSDALVENKRAQEIDPMRVVFYRVLEAGILRFARRYDEALRKLEDAIEMQPDISGAPTELGYTYAAKGMYKEAIEAYQKSMSIEGENTSDQVFLGFAYAMSGNRKQALTILNGLKSTKQYVSPAELAILYVGLGDKDGAFKELERAYAEHDLQLQYLKVDAHYDYLRSDPRFLELMRRVRLPGS